MRGGGKMEDDIVATFLTSRQYQIYSLLRDGNSYREAAAKMGVSVGTIKDGWHRIKKKIDAFNAIEDINEVVEIYNQEINKDLPSGLTLGMAQFLSTHQNMKITKEQAYKQRRRTGYNPKTKTLVRKMTEDEQENCTITTREMIPASIIRIEMEYRSRMRNHDQLDEDMAAMETILRAYGILYSTPAINKLNAKTSKVLRAKEEGYRPTLFEPGDIPPPGSRYIEVSRNEAGEKDYSLWLVPSRVKVKGC